MWARVGATENGCIPPGWREVGSHVPWVMETETKSQLRQFIRMTFLRNEHAALSDGTSLLASGMMDSTDTLELILYLESEFGITVGDEEAGPENLDTIERIAAFIAGKRSGGSAPVTQ